MSNPIHIHGEKIKEMKIIETFSAKCNTVREGY